MSFTSSVHSLGPGQGLGLSSLLGSSSSTGRGDRDGQVGRIGMSERGRG